MQPLGIRWFLVFGEFSSARPDFKCAGNRHVNGFAHHPFKQRCFGNASFTGRLVERDPRRTAGPEQKLRIQLDGYITIRQYDLAGIDIFDDLFRLFGIREDFAVVHALRCPMSINLLLQIDSREFFGERSVECFLRRAPQFALSCTGAHQNNVIVSIDVGQNDLNCHG